MGATEVIRSMNEEREGHRQEDIVVVHEGITEIVSSGFEEDQGFDGSELLAAAEEGRTDKVLEVCEPHQIHFTLDDTFLKLPERKALDDTFLELPKLTYQHSEQKTLDDTFLKLPKLTYQHFEQKMEIKDQVSFTEQVMYDKHYEMTIPIRSMCLVDVEMELNSRALENNEDDDEEDYYDEDDEDEEAAEAKICLMKWSKLRNAVRKGQEDIVQQILEQDPELVQYVHDSEGTTLHVAVRTGQLSTLKQLIHFIMTSSKLTKVMLETDTLRDTALHTALKNNHHKAAKYLIEAAPQAVYQVNDKGVSPLVIAVEKGHEDLLRCMIRQTSLSSSVKQSMLYHAKEISLPHTAIKAKNLGTLQALMEELPSLINLSNVKGWKPLSYAASKGYLDQVIYLLKTFPQSANRCDKDGSFPIHKAVVGGHLDILKEFAVSCPDTLFATDKKGRSILHIAVRYLKGDVLAFLKKDSGIEKIFNIRDNAGNTFMDMEEKSN